MLKSSVRLAFVASVTCDAPPVSRQISKESTVPNASSPRSAAAFRSATILQQPAELRAGEIRIEDETGLAP